MLNRRLGRLEKAQTMCGEYASFTAARVLLRKKGPPPDGLRPAVEGLPKKPPLLQVRIQREGGNCFFVQARSLPLPSSELLCRDKASSTFFILTLILESRVPRVSPGRLGLSRNPHACPLDEQRIHVS